MTHTLKWSQNSLLRKTSSRFQISSNRRVIPVHAVYTSTNLLHLYLESCVTNTKPTLLWFDCLNACGKLCFNFRVMRKPSWNWNLKRKRSLMFRKPWIQVQVSCSLKISGMLWKSKSRVKHSHSYIATMVREELMHSGCVSRISEWVMLTMRSQPLSPDLTKMGTRLGQAGAGENETRAGGKKGVWGFYFTWADLENSWH